MPYANGRIYRDTTVTPNLGVSIADIQAALNDASFSDIGGIIQNAAARDLVNPFAKFKPFRWNLLADPTDLARIDMNYGLYIPYYIRIGTMVEDMYNERWTYAENYNAQRTPWEWEPPRGFSVTPHEPYRFLDFDGYFKDAVPFAQQVQTPIVVPVTDTATTFRFPYAYDPAAIAPSDLVPHGALISTTRYLGVCVFAGTGSSSRYVWTMDEVSDYDDDTISYIWATVNNIAAGWYRAFLFISDREIELGGTEEIGEYIPIAPSFSYVNVQMEQWDLNTLSIEADQLGQSVGVGWSVKLGNNTIKQASVECRYYYKDANDQEVELLPRYEGTVNLSYGTNRGDCDRSSVNYIIWRVVVTITITDSIHGNEDIYGEAYPNQL